MHSFHDARERASYGSTPGGCAELTLYRPAREHVAMIRTIKVLVKLPGNKTQTLTETVPAEWITGDRDALSELLQNDKVRTKISVNADHVVSVQISEPWNPMGSARVVRG